MFLKSIIIVGVLFRFTCAFSKSRVELISTDKASVIKVLEVNESLLSSFFSYEAKDVEKLSKELSLAISKISNAQIREKLNYSQKLLLEISAKSSREENDQKYHLVSMALIHVINTYDLGKGYNAYSCPMVKKKWVQNSTKRNKVHNPYAPSMPHCGGKDTTY